MSNVRVAIVRRPAGSGRRRATTLPETADEPGLAYQAMASATSIGWPPCDIEFMRRPASRMPSGMVLTMSVSMNPGAIALAVMPSLATRLLSAVIQPMTPALAEP